MNIEPDFDEAERVRPLLPNLLVGSEASAYIQVKNIYFTIRYCGPCYETISKVG